MTRSLGAVSLTVGLVLLGSVSGWAGFPGTDVFLASVGGGPGDAGSRWYTTVWIHNPTESVANVQLTFLVRNQTNPAPTGVYDDTVSPGDTRRYDNAVQTLFGLTDAFGAIRVTSTESLVVTSRIYSLPVGGEDQDSTGQLFTATPASFAIGAGQSTELLGVYQSQPAAESQFATTSVSWRRVAQRHRAGERFRGVNPIADHDYVVGRLEVRQYSISSQFPDLLDQRAWRLRCSPAQQGDRLGSGSPTGPTTLHRDDLRRGAADRRRRVHLPASRPGRG
jgi:hypothetical protein